MDFQDRPQTTPYKDRYIQKFISTNIPRPKTSQNNYEGGDTVDKILCNGCGASIYSKQQFQTNFNNRFKKSNSNNVNRPLSGMLGRKLSSVKIQQVNNIKQKMVNSQQNFYKSPYDIIVQKYNQLIGKEDIQNEIEQYIGDTQRHNNVIPIDYQNQPVYPNQNPNYGSSPRLFQSGQQNIDEIQSQQQSQSSTQKILNLQAPDFVSEKSDNKPLLSPKAIEQYKFQKPENDKMKPIALKEKKKIKYCSFYNLQSQSNATTPRSSSRTSFD